jgi:nitrate/TMAO reductase-like tetraheme cytochrome c subunit
MNQLVTFVILCWTLIAGITLANNSYGNSCTNCHSNPDIYAQDQVIYKYYLNWSKSPHKTAGLTCDFCHNGNPDAQDKDAAHQSILDKTNPLSKLHYENLSETCGSCHSDIFSQFRKSKHFRALQDERPAPSCIVCHRVLHAKPRNRNIAEQHCRNCHFDQNPQNLPLIADRAEEFLSRLGITKIYLDWLTTFYEEQNWPGGTQQRVESIRRRNTEVVARVHRFDLENMDENSAKILSETKELFRQAWNEKQIIK